MKSVKNIYRPHVILTTPPPLAKNDGSEEEALLEASPPHEVFVCGTEYLPSSSGKCVIT